MKIAAFVAANALFCVAAFALLIVVPMIADALATVAAAVAGIEAIR